MTKPVLELPSLENPSVSQLQMVDLLRRHIVLQDQFDQLTEHVQECYNRIESLYKIINNKILS